MNFDSFEDIKGLMDNFDPASLLPDLSSMAGIVATITRLAVIVGPLVLLVLGLLYFFAAPKEANYRFGYRCYFGMGSEEAWRFTQRLAGILWAALGLVLTILMLIISGGYGGKDISQVISSGFRCLIWELVLTGLSVLAINLLTMLRYDRKGLRRSGGSKKDL
ncbi:MAG: SdpI family protein [Oscillospiraceae bacterium]|nr:SdpI family protein [Oscillospiraceae bacterium]